MQRVVKFLEEESGASAAEYALILSLIAVSLISSSVKLGTTISSVDFKVANAISGAVSGGGAPAS